jgi:hypothetical protein
MLAAGALKDLLLVGIETYDVLMSRQRLLHRSVHVIALAGALAPVEGRQYTCGGK